MTLSKLAPAAGCLILLLALPTSVRAQRHTISGTISDDSSGESLIGANVSAVTLNKGTASNTYGFYSLTLPRADSLTLVFSYIGYQPQVKKVYLTQNIELDIQLAPSSAELGEIAITADRATRDNVLRTRMGVVDVSIQAVERLPAILGEQDVLKVIQLLPGVQSGEEGTVGFHVRLAPDGLRARVKIHESRSLKLFEMISEHQFQNPGEQIEHHQWTEHQNETPHRVLRTDELGCEQRA